MSVQRFNVRVYDDHFLIEKEKGDFVMIECDTKLGAKLKELAGMVNAPAPAKVKRKRRTKEQIAAEKAAPAEVQ